MSNREQPELLDEAAERFSKFLRGNGYSERVLWVEKADLLWDRQQLWIRQRTSETAWNSARQRYAEGISRGFGVWLYAFSEAAGNSIAVVLKPESEDASQRLLMPRWGLKLSAAIKKLPAHLVDARLQWLLLSLHHRTASQSFRANYFDCS